MRKKNLCVYLMLILPALLGGVLNNTQMEIDKAWIIVPWSKGGHYYHNTITKEDKDQL
jgi:hypothetical protein